MMRKLFSNNSFEQNPSQASKSTILLFQFTSLGMDFFFIDFCAMERNLGFQLPGGRSFM